MISVIIPTLNEEKFLPKLLDSLICQTNKDFEVIVVDGSSKDKTVEMARSFAPKLLNMKVIVSSKASLPLQRNLGARATSGEWLVFVDADCIFSPYFIERTLQFIRTNSPKLFTTWFLPDKENSKDAIYTLFCSIYIETTIMLKRTFAPGPLSIVRRDAYESVNGYDEAHTYHEDVDFGLRLAKRGVVLQVLRETLCVWSLRRFRKEGLMKVLNQYFIGVWPILFFKTSFKYMPGYVMGGQVYGKKKRKFSLDALRKYEKQLRKLMKEFFE